MKKWLHAGLENLSIFGKGQLNRIQYIRNNLIAFGIPLLLFLIFLGINLLMGEQIWSTFISFFFVKVTLVILYTSLILLGLFVHYYAVYQRWHDLNKSGYNILWSFVPVANIIVWLYFSIGIRN